MEGLPKVITDIIHNYVDGMQHLQKHTKNLKQIAKFHSILKWFKTNKVEHFNRFEIDSGCYNLHRWGLQKMSYYSLKHNTYEPLTLEYN